MAEKLKLPKTLGETIDLIFQLREKRSAAELVVKAIQDQEDALEAHLMSNFDKSGLDGAKGKFASASIIHSDVPDVVDWNKVWTYIHKNKADDLVQKRISVTACRERWANKKAIPGVEVKSITTLRINKVKPSTK